MDKSSRPKSKGKTSSAKNKERKPYRKSVKLTTTMDEHHQSDTYRSQIIKEDSEKLLKATKNKEYGFVETLLTESAALHLDITDDVGKTALHYLCNNGRTDEVRLCLKRRPRVNKMDKLGWTPLHYAAMKDHGEIVHMLVRHGADPNKPDAEKGRTALHLAVSRDNQSIAEQLIQLGADPKVADQDGKTVIDISKNELMRDRIQIVAKKVAEESAENEAKEERKDIYEKMDIALDKTTPFPNLGLAVTPITSPTDTIPETNNIETKSFTMLIRKYNPEAASDYFDLKDDEDICSELFVHEISRVTGHVTLSINIPITCPPSNTEELVLKTDRGIDVFVNEVKEDNRKWMCVAEAEVTSFRSFIVVSRPKLEKFNIGSGPTNIRSSVDNRVELQIPQNTFDTSVTITMGITETPQKEDLTKVMSGCDALSSFTAFYSLDSGGKTLAKPISLKVPVPTTYQGDGQLVVLTMNDDPDHETPDSWKMLSTVNEIKQDSIHFDVQSFSIKVVVELSSSIGRSDTESMGSLSSFASISSQISRVYRKCRRREYAVSLLCLSRRIGTSNKFKIIAQCCKNDQIEANIVKWENEGYECHTNVAEMHDRDELKVRSKQKFKIVTEGLDILTDKNDILVEFQPKLETSFQTLTVGMPDRTVTMNGKISFIKLDKATENSESGATENSETGATQQDVSNVDIVASVDVTFLKFHPDMMSKLDGTSFLNYKRMLHIQAELGDVWWKCILLMEISFKTLEKALVESSGNLQEAVNGLLFDWREKQRSYKSRGLPVLLSALGRCAKRGLVNNLQVQLREWKKLPGSKNDEFYDWLITAYKLDLLVPTVYDAPMSDAYLAMVADRLKPTKQLEKSLSLPIGTLDDITDNPRCYPCDGMVTMKMLVTFRQNCSDNGDALRQLVEAMRDTGLKKDAEYTVMIANAWLKRQAGEENEFSDVIKQLSKT